MSVYVLSSMAKPNYIVLLAYDAAGLLLSRLSWRSLLNVIPKICFYTDRKAEVLPSKYRAMLWLDYSMRQQRVMLAMHDLFKSTGMQPTQLFAKSALQK